MPAKEQLGRLLFPAAIGTVVSAIGFAGHSVATSTAGAIVAQIVAGIAVNYTSEKLSTLLGSIGAGQPSAVNDDLDRVGNHALLTILYETASEHGQDATQAVRDAAKACDLRIFRNAAPSPGDLVGVIRAPRDLSQQQAEEIAREFLPIGFGHLLSDYSAAIAARFAQTFEVLLRRDERAYRAVALYLQRLEHEDLAQLRTDLADALGFLRNPQPELRLYETLRKQGDRAVEITDLQFKRRATRYRVRAPVDSLLRDWLLSEDRFRILKLTGPAGMGKSRLALQICDWGHQQHWLAGFVQESDWPAAWQPIRDTLAVLDYAASKSIDGRTAFQWLESVFLQTTGVQGERNAPPARVRIVLIDRSDQGPLWTHWRSSEVEQDLAKCTLAVTLEPDRIEFDEIVRDELKRCLGREASNEEIRRANQLAERLRGQFRPLFALLTARALADSTHAPASPWSPELLLESILKSQVRQWSVAGIQDEDLDLLFEATLTQGACNDDEEFKGRLDALSPSGIAALANLSEPGRRLGAIVPDLLGECFVLMRLRGEATTSTRQTVLNVNVSRSILERSWKHETTATFAGLLLEDYLPWTPQTGQNPAVDISRQALTQIEEGGDSFGLRYCCFATAWKRPESMDWAEWLQRAPVSSGSTYAPMCAMGLFNATVGEPDPARRLALAERIEVLHTQYGQEPTVREPLAKALFNATVGERDAARSLALAVRIEALHTQYGQEPAVREPLAKAFHNVTVVEPDPKQCLALAQRIEVLHTQYGQERAVREQLAKAFCNATVVEPDPEQRLTLAERIAALHKQYGQEPAVRGPLAQALLSVTAVEPDPKQRLALAQRIEVLHSQYGQEPAVREQLAKAFCNATVVEPDPEQRLALAERIEALHTQHGQEPAVREPLAKALLNVTAVEPDPKQRLALAQRIEVLHSQYGQEPAVREHLAKALFNATFGESDPARKAKVLERLTLLLANHPAEFTAVRKALVHLTGDLP
jgi:hypothetical protein